MNIFESYFSVDYKKPTALICMTAFALSIPFRILGYKEDLPVVMGFSPALSTSMWLKEFSMLCIMFGLSMCGMAFEKK